MYLSKGLWFLFMLFQSITFFYFLSMLTTVTRRTSLVEQMTHPPNTPLTFFWNSCCSIFPVLTQDISSYVTTSFNICMNLISVICRWLFFTDVSNHRIIRCGLDGSDIKTFRFVSISFRTLLVPYSGFLHQ
jgi:hypothetical protein